MLHLFDSFDLIDLTHTIDKDIPTWDGERGFSEHIDASYEQGCCLKRYCMEAGIGTHMDAPQHFIKGALHVGQIKLEHLFVPAYVVDVSQKVKSDDDYNITVEDMRAFEKKYEPIQENTLVLAYTGWGARWPDMQKYRNADKEGNMHFPGFSVDAGQYLLEKKVVGIGIDTFSPDGSNYNFPLHTAFLGAGKYLIENVANLEKVPPVGAYIVALPLKIKGGTESPARIMALVPKK